MSALSPTDLRHFVRNYLSESLKAQQKDLPSELPDSCDLLLAGLIDSLGLLELLTAIQEYCQREIDFDGLDPEQITVVGPLCDFVSNQLGTSY